MADRAAVGVLVLLCAATFSPRAAGFDGQTPATESELEAVIEAEGAKLVSLRAEERRLKEELLGLQLAEVKRLIDEGKKAEAAAAMAKYEQGSAEFKLSHLAWEHFPSTPPPTTGLEALRGEDYIFVDVGSDRYVYNSLRLDQPSRIRHLLNSRLLTLIKELAQAAKGAGTYGLALALDIPYRSFSDAGQGVSYDALKLYLPLAEIQRFGEYEITSQDLIDSSVVIVNGNRVAVDLD